MIKLFINERVKLSNGDEFIVTEEHDEFYNGYIECDLGPGLQVTMQVVLFRSNGMVYETMLNTYIATYEIQMELPIQKICDCGGYKTYNTYAPECHSAWCQVHYKRIGYAKYSI